MAALDADIMWPVLLAACAVVSPLQLRASHAKSLVARTATVSSQIKLGKKSSSWEDTEKDLLGAFDLTEEDGDNVDTPSAEDQAAPAANPRSGSQPWGRWSHEGDSVELELMLPDGVRARDLVCEVNKQGLMRVQAGSSPPLLSGRVVLPVDRTELAWMVEDGLLCIEVPLIPVDPNQMKYVDSIFDDSLVVNGMSCITPGLSGSQ